MIRIGIFSGGTGGHIFPAMAVAEELKSRGLPYTLNLGGLKIDFPTNHNYSKYDAAEILPKNSLRIIKGILQTFDTVIQSDVLLGFGGYPTFPPLFNALINNKPIYLFEGDAKPGKANKLFSFFSRRVFCAFRRTTNYYPNSEFVGIPVRKLKVHDKDEAADILGINTNLPIVGVLGGSQGSRFLNDLAKSLTETNEFFVLGIVGRYGNDSKGKNFRFLKFLDDISPFYSLVDVLIARAGMSTIGEVSYYKIPTLFIPYPYAGGHQILNALDVVEFGGGKILLEDEVSLEKVVEILNELLKNREKYGKRLEKYFIPDAPSRIVEGILRDI